MEVTIEVGKENRILTGNGAVVNIARYGKFQIRKLNYNTKEAMDSVRFDIYDNPECSGRPVGSMTTGAEGYALSPLLDPAVSYYIKEVVPSGFAAPAEISGPFTVTANQVTEAGTEGILYNQRYFSLEIEKRDSETGNLIQAPATFALYGSREDAENGRNELARKESTAGKAVFEKLLIPDEKEQGTDSGVFYVKEISAPDGYAQPEEDITEVEIVYSDTAVKITRIISNVPLGTIRLHKEGKWQGIGDSESRTISLEGAVFAVYAVSKNGAEPSASAVAADTISTDQYGDAETKGLPEGWYAIKEQSAPDGFVEREDAPAYYWCYVSNATANETFVETPIENMAVKGDFLLIKYDGFENSPKDQLTSLTLSLIHI